MEVARHPSNPRFDLCNQENELCQSKIEMSGFELFRNVGFLVFKLSLKAHFASAAARSSALLSIIAFRSIGFSSRCLRVLLARIFGLTGSP
jgi:hypothetical protein